MKQQQFSAADQPPAARCLLPVDLSSIELSYAPLTPVTPACYRPRVNSSNLTPDQLKQLGEILRRQLNFLGRLRSRMERLGFRPDDRLYLATTEAFNAVHALHVECHYLTCPTGVGRSGSP